MTAAAQPLIERSLTAELLVDSAVPQPPAISPDGRWVAYLVTTVGTREHKLSELWVAPADASSPPARLTGGTAWVSLPRWASGLSLAFLLVRWPAAPDRPRRGRLRSAGRLAR